MGVDVEGRIIIQVGRGECVKLTDRELIVYLTYNNAHCRVRTVQYL